MYTFYNPHPENKNVRDCVKRSLTKATSKSYSEISKELNKIKRNQKVSSYAVNSVWNEYLNSLNAIRRTYPAIKGKSRMNGKSFCEENPTGVYILSMAGHLTCCYNGIIYDTWDCSSKCVYASYEIPSVTVEDEENIFCSIAASPAPTMSKISGEYIIEKMSELTSSTIKRTKDGEPWISLNETTYHTVRDRLLSKEYEELVFETIKGSKIKMEAIDKETGSKFILKGGSNPYLWYLKR